MLWLTIGLSPSSIHTGNAGTAQGVTIYNESSIIMTSGTIDVAATDYTIGIRGLSGSTIILNGKVVSESPYVTNSMILGQGGKYNYGAHLSESTMLSTNSIFQGAPSSDPQGENYPRGVGVSSSSSTIAIVGGKMISDPMYGVSNGPNEKVVLFDLIIAGDVGGNIGYGACAGVTRTFENGTEEILSTDCKRSE